MSDSSNVEAGRELADPETMQGNEQEQTEAQAPAEAINGFDGLYPRMTGQVWATVLSLRNDNVTAYRCKLDELECYAADGSDCPDLGYNHDGAGVCDHLAAAIFQAPGKPDMETTAVNGAINILDHLKDAAASAHNTAKVMERAQASNATASAQESTGDVQDTAEGDETDNAGEDPDDAAERLQEAFDGVVDDMQVKAANGYVWFQTGQDTPDEWPYPGGDETFKVVTGPDMVRYVHDGSQDWADGPHDLYDLKPGEWWKNALAPEDVDEYISEVLE